MLLAHPEMAETEACRNMLAAAAAAQMAERQVPLGQYQPPEALEATTMQGRAGELAEL